MGKLKVWFTVIVISLLMFTMTGCKKNSSVDLKPSFNAANDVILSNRPFIYVFNMLVRAVTDSVLQQTHHAVIDSAELSFDHLTNQYVFQFSGKMGHDSVRRYGSFRATLDSNFFIPGTSVGITFQGYAEDSHSITGIDSILNTGISTDGKLGFVNSIREALISKDTIRVIRWQALQTCYLDPTVFSSHPDSALIRIEGSGQGVSSMGFTFSTTISTPLQDLLSCPWIRGGIIALSIPEAPVQTGTINFSNPGCTDKVIYDFEGTIYYWKLKNKYLQH